MITATDHVNRFDFSKLNDVQLRETFHLWRPENTPGDSPEWLELYAAGRAAIIEETHRRALGIKVREVVITSTGRRVGGWDGHSFRNCDRHVGTASEFAEAFGLRLINRPCAPQGSAKGVDGNGYEIELSWQVV